jgi:hypothetical protein
MMQDGLLNHLAEGGQNLRLIQLFYFIFNIIFIVLEKDNYCV